MFNLDRHYRPMFFFAPFGDGGGGGGEEEKAEKPEHTQESIDFHKKFSANRPGVNLPPGTTGAAPVKEEVKTEQEAEVATTPEEEKKPTLTQKKPGSNIPKILEDKRKAEEERDQLRQRAEKFDKEDKPALEKRITDLEAEIAEGGHTRQERAELQEKLASAEKRLQEREESLVNENKQLRTQLSFHDIQSDPDFRDQFVKPIESSYTEAVEPLQGDPAKMQLLRKALLANSAALSTGDKDERLAQERERNTVLSQIADSLDEFSRGQFTTAMNAYIRAAKAHASALGQHEETRTQITKKRQDAASQARTQIFKQWSDHNATVSPVYDADASIDGELADAIKELKLKPEDEVKSSGDLVTKVITGHANMEESVDLLQRGRVYPALVAKNKAQAHIIKGLRDTIQKLRGSKAAGDAKDGRENESPQKETRQQFNSRFSATRPGAILGRQVE